MFFRTFGFYLSSFILMSISVDRYLSMVYPLNIQPIRMANQRGRIMLILAWVFSGIASVPQVSGYS